MKSESEKVGISHLPVSDQQGSRDDRIRPIQVIRPELMLVCPGHLSQQSSGFPRSHRSIDEPRIRRNTNETALRERTRCPSAAALSVEPLLGLTMVHVGRPGECDQQVDVEQKGQESSSALVTVSLVIGLAPSGISNTGKYPGRSLGSLAGVSPLRMSSETIFPIETPCWAAIALAAASRSSSIFKVVLMMTL